jgi:hypothetical protein
MPIDIAKTVDTNLEKRAKQLGETDKVSYPLRLGTAEALLMIAMNHVHAHHGEQALRDMIRAMTMDAVENI